ncbi:hypothetical protein GPJ56_007209 [Histomonas meleagridis]|nr:hypothetical protein GPJ56_007209 [Histomonas meleagridis]
MGATHLGATAWVPHTWVPPPPGRHPGCHAGSAPGVTTGSHLPLGSPATLGLTTWASPATLVLHRTWASTHTWSTWASPAWVSTTHLVSTTSVSPAWSPPPPGVTATGFSCTWSPHLGSHHWCHTWVPHWVPPAWSLTPLSLHRLGPSAATWSPATNCSTAWSSLPGPHMPGLHYLRLHHWASPAWVSPQAQPGLIHCDLCALPGAPPTGGSARWAPRAQTPRGPALSVARADCHCMVMRAVIAPSFMPWVSLPGSPLPGSHHTGCHALGATHWVPPTWCLTTECSPP